ncbi:hypothetical protein BDZ85DRAFT_289735 [Elsinoe ampelina]|uniref:U1-type domain-containing protein n=1 Tax=Elsinoe ampelina TaxID=302913 RepID=A0A6A6GBQ0_9PEZI|nr:hypothetical protein BDZ85DRAFT_289735 [Elsinoe ampelina]
MSEYWKSTPKYWCKFCKTYVRDTTLEKKQHEQTGKHQSAIQKSLRELHKTQSREEREKQRAKDEVRRITGAVDGKPVAGPSGGKSAGVAGAASAPVSVAKARPTFTREHKVATAEDRRRQAEQLAKLGVAVPDEFRGDMAVPGEWSTVEVREVYRAPAAGGVKKEEGEEGKEGVAEGVKRRRGDGVEDEDEEADRVNSKRKVWGSTLKSYPGSKEGQGEDFDALLSNALVKKEVRKEVKEEDLEDGVKLKTEESGENDGVTKSVEMATAASSDQKTEEVASDTPVVFKKRKGKR